MKVMITGATGYIGYQLALTLADKNYQVNALVRDLSLSLVYEIAMFYYQTLRRSETNNNLKNNENNI